MTAAAHTTGTVVVDANVWISAFLSPRSTAAAVVLSLIDRGTPILATPQLLEELERTLGSKKFRRYAEGKDEFCAHVRDTVTMVSDVADPAPVTRDPNDDYLVALATTHKATIVTGDKDLLDADTPVTVHTPRQHLEAMTSTD